MEYHIPRFQTILQSYGNQNSMALVPKQTHRSVEHNKEPRIELMYIWTSNLHQTRQHTICKGERTTSSINSFGRIGQLHANKSNWTTHTIHKNKFKNGLKTNVRPETIIFLQENRQQAILDMSLQGRATKTNNKSDCHTKKLLQIEGSYQQNGKATY